MAVSSIAMILASGGADGVGRIPTMSAETTSGVTMTATSTIGSGADRSGWKAGDKTPVNTGTGANSWTSANGVNGNLNIDLGASYTIRSYDASNNSGYQSGLTTSWTFEGATASDYSDAVTLDTHGPVSWGTPSTVTRQIVSPGSYRYYRFVSTARGGSFSGFSEVQVYT